MRKIIFLDIDGVLNSHDWWAKRGKLAEENYAERWRTFELDPEAISRFKQLLEYTGAEVVLSSTWRLWEDNRAAVKDMVVDFIGITKECTSRIRGAEIHMWISENLKWDERESLKYAIIDDDSDMLLWQKDHFFQTTPEHGLTEEICKQLKEHLGAKE